MKQESKPYPPIWDADLRALNLIPRVRKLLNDAGIKYVGELICKSAWSLHDIRGLGFMGRDHLERMVEAHHLQFGTNVLTWKRPDHH
jgi:DNA-directed RNA polymerase alpha subunit